MRFGSFCACAPQWSPVTAMFCSRMRLAWIAGIFPEAKPMISSRPFQAMHLRLWSVVSPPTES